MPPRLPTGLTRDGLSLQLVVEVRSWPRSVASSEGRNRVSAPSALGASLNREDVILPSLENICA